MVTHTYTFRGNTNTITCGEGAEPMGRSAPPFVLVANIHHSSHAYGLALSHSLPSSFPLLFFSSPRPLPPLFIRALLRGARIRAYRPHTRTRANLRIPRIAHNHHQNQKMPRTYTLRISHPFLCRFPAPISTPSTTTRNRRRTHHANIPHATTSHEKYRSLKASLPPLASPSLALCPPLLSAQP